MTSEAQSLATVLPVTALEIVKINSTSILLVGQGSFLGAYALLDDSFHPLHHCRVFESNNIHGISSTECSNREHDHPSADVLIYGGQSVSLTRLSASKDDAIDATSKISFLHGEEFIISDWLLYACVLNSSFKTYLGLGITAQNALVGLRHAADGENRSLRLSEHPICSGPRSVLYSAHLIYADSDRVLIAAGTVFGEALVWSCGLSDHDDQSVWTVHGIYTGHTGSVFGVCISGHIRHGSDRGRLLASCSDDRTIRIWSIDETADVSDDFMDAVDGHSNSTGFGTTRTRNAQPMLAMTWAHLSRIWKVKFLPRLERNDDRLLLLSVGEDATCQLWNLVLGREILTTKDETKLVHIASDRHHSGKNIWSVAFVQCGEHLTIATGGAEGCVVLRSREMEHYQPDYLEVGLTSTTFLEVSTQATSDAKSLKQYCFLDNDRVLATTDTSSLIMGEIDLSKNAIAWSSHFQPSKRSPLMLTAATNASLAITATGRKILAVSIDYPYSAEDIVELENPVMSVFIAWSRLGACKEKTEILLMVTSRVRSAVSLIWASINDPEHPTRESVVDLPDNFVPTSACYLPKANLLILGSRSGALGFYQNIIPLAGSTRPSKCIRHVLDSDSVTTIMDLDQGSNVQNIGAVFHILICGRNGCYAVHRILQEHAQLAIETVHKSSPPFGPNIEGAYLTPSSNNTQSSDLLLYGFRSKDFIVWNETQQLEVLSVDCGGAHRNWAYRPHSPRTGQDPSISGGSFIWTKAGSVNFYCKTKIGQKVVQDGGHGREIKALAKCSIFYRDLDRGIKNATLIATGAEDTTVRLFAIDDNLTSNTITRFQRIRTLKRHTTGIQHLVFSRDGKFLFSSAGCEEFFVWRIHNGIPCFGIGVVAWDALPKEDGDEDARITHFDLREGNGRRDGMMFAAAYSNGKLRVFLYTANSTPGTGIFEMLWESNAGMFCLTQAHMFGHRDKSMRVLTAGTNGHVNTSLLPLNLDRTTPTSQQSQQPVPSHLQLQPQVHQNSIKVLHTIPIDPHYRLLITGGDDNAVALTLLRQGSRRLELLRIPSAHAAAVTATAVLSTQTYNSDTEDGWRRKLEVVWASTGCDQRVKIWRVVVTLQNGSGELALLTTDDLHVEMVGECWTSVADVGGMELLSEVEVKGDEWAEAVYGKVCRLVVVGVGMEILEIQIPPATEMRR